MKFLTVHCNVLRIFDAKEFPPPTHTLLMSRSDIEAVGKTFNFFSYDEILTENRTHRLPYDEPMCCVLCHGRGFDLSKINLAAYPLS